MLQQQVQCGLGDNVPVLQYHDMWTNDTTPENIFSYDN